MNSSLSIEKRAADFEEREVGATPLVALIQATDGNFYGTAFGGGSNSCTPFGCGTVFKITPSGTFTTLYRFCSQSGCTDGESPFAGLVQATDGNFYGATDGPGGAGLSFQVCARG